jgi:pimeloyl-ACP methyl ester carboxylesterase
MKKGYMKRIINGLSVNTFGDENKQSIIFVHGFPFDHTMWENQINFLKENYYCVAYDVRGLGLSIVGDGQYTMEFFVDDLFSIISELKLNSPVLCGLSMGGYIALRAVERNQILFSALILLDTRPEADDNAGKLKRSAGINQINTEGLEIFTKAFVTNCFADDAPIEKKEMFERTLQKSFMHNPVGVKGCLIAIMSRTDTTQFLPNIKIPTLVICGSFDKLTPPSVMRTMAEKIPGAEFAVVPLAAHITPLENPANVNDLINGFLKRKVVM